MLKKYIAKEVSKKEKSAINEAVSEVEKRINSIKKETILIILLNIFTMICVPLLFDNVDTIKLIISLVVSFSVLYTIVEVLKEYKKIYEFIFICGMNPKMFIFQEIRKEVKLRAEKELDDLTWWESIANQYAGKGTSELSLIISGKATKIVLENISQFLGIFFVTWVIYIFYIRGLLLEKSVHMTFYEAILYPLSLL